jgi:hypothetical protein
MSAGYHAVCAHNNRPVPVHSLGIVAEWAATVGLKEHVSWEGWMAKDQNRVKAEVKKKPASSLKEKRKVKQEKTANKRGSAAS